MEQSNEWLFPIRMENANKIEQVDNIVECFAQFKRPCGQGAWEHLLRQRLIDAYNEHDRNLLRQWWNEGWQYTPKLAYAPQKPIPVMRIGHGPLGDTLETVYPTLRSFCSEQGCHKETAIRAAEGKKDLFSPHWSIRLARETISAKAKLTLEPKELRWTLFAPDNTILGQYRTQADCVAQTDLTRGKIDAAHKRHMNRLSDGRWIWCDNWGIMPISPDDEPLGMNWRETYAPENRVEGKFDF